MYAQSSENELRLLLEAESGYFEWDVTFVII